MDHAVTSFGPTCCCGSDRLTNREAGLLPLLAAGRTNGQIAKELALSSATVAHHVQQLMQKMAAGCRTELVARAYTLGLLAIDAWPPVPTGRRCL